MIADLIAEIFAFLVILLVLYRYVWPLVKRLVGERQETVQQHVDESEAAERKLAEAHERFDSAVAEAENEAARIRDDARADATRIRDELVEQAEREVERIKQRGAEQLAAQRDQVVRGLRAELGGQSMALAERIVVEQLADEGRRSTTVESFLADLEQLPSRTATPEPASERQVAPAGGGAS